MARFNEELLKYHSNYLNNEVLKNKLNITDDLKLQEVERKMVQEKLDYLKDNPNLELFNIKEYLNLHKYLFEDIYDFAGETRNEVIHKLIPFCLPQFIYTELNNVLSSSKLKLDNINTKEDLLLFITKLESDLDLIHPFREGNGRVLREFVRQYILYICERNNIEPFYIDYDLINKDDYIIALAKADSNFEYEDLYNLLTSGVVNISLKK